jgi:hypothetical protein
MFNVFTTNDVTRGVERDDVFGRATFFVVAHMQYESESTISVEVVAKLGIVMFGSAKLRKPSDYSLLIGHESLLAARSFVLNIGARGNGSG